MRRPGHGPARRTMPVALWSRIGARWLPFADAASEVLPLSRLLRLSLFQISVGIALVMLNGTLNRVMIVELGVPTWLVAAMLGLPLLFAPLRALLGHRSDTHRSALGWRRVPYIWFGTLLQFGGFAIMPFALLVLSGDTHGPIAIGQAGAALAFLMVGAGLHTTQTAGLALATDLARPEDRPRVVALLYLMLLVGMVAAGLVFGALLRDFSQIRLIQVVQGAALMTMALNVVALWKQEARQPSTTRAAREPRPRFRAAWDAFARDARPRRLLVTIGLGTAAFGMQDALLEPYGGQILGMAVGQTTALTALMAGGSLIALAIASRWLSGGGDPHRLAATGLLAGIVAFAGVVFADPLGSILLFGFATTLIGFGAGLFSVAMLCAAMELGSGDRTGLALGAWGAVQATAAGLAVAGGGALRDVVSRLAVAGDLGPALAGPSVGYSVVYHVEILLLFATLVALGPLTRRRTPQGPDPQRPRGRRLGLAELPG